MKCGGSLHRVQYDLVLDSFVRAASQSKIAINGFFSLSQDANVCLQLWKVNSLPYSKALQPDIL